MIKSNSKIVTEKIKNYIIENYADVCGDYFDENGATYCEKCAGIASDASDYKKVCNSILIIFKAEYLHEYNRRRNRQELFFDWCSGLCSAINTSYFYNVCAVDLLAGWLEETDAEKIRYSEADAEKMITYLIFRELTKHGDYKIIL